MKLKVTVLGCPGRSSGRLLASIWSDCEPCSESWPGADPNSNQLWVAHHSERPTAGLERVIFISRTDLWSRDSEVLGDDFPSSRRAGGIAEAPELIPLAWPHESPHGRAFKTGQTVQARCRVGWVGVNRGAEGGPRTHDFIARDRTQMYRHRGARACLFLAATSKYLPVFEANTACNSLPVVGKKHTPRR